MGHLARIRLILSAQYASNDAMPNEIPTPIPLAALPASGKLMGLDLGTKTIGVAVSDGLQDGGDAGRNDPADQVHRRRRTAAGADRRPMPSSASSSACRSTWTARKARACSRPAPSCATSPKDRSARRLLGRTLSTAAVTRTLIEADMSRAKRGEVVDKLAAAYILQGALDRLQHR